MERVMLTRKDKKESVALISRDENIAFTVMPNLFKDYEYYNDNKYINFSENENKKEATKNVALMIKHKVLAKLNINEGNNYLNVSVNDNNVVDASVALMVKHQSNKLGPSGLPGSKLYLSESPGWGATTFIQAPGLQSKPGFLKKNCDDSFMLKKEILNKFFNGGYEESYANP